jgi:hypothetical protein
LAVGLLGVLGLTAASCVAIVGADEERLPIAKKLCECSPLDFLGDNCENDVAKRLGQVSDEARADWMRAAEAKGCLASCTNSLECYRIAPTCSKTICNTGLSEECCAGFSCDPESKQCFED